MGILESTLALPSSLPSAFHKKENWLSHRKSRKIKIALINFTFAAQRRWKACFWLMSSGVMVTQCGMGCRMSLQGWEGMCFSRLYFSKHISQKLFCQLFLQLKTELIPTELKPQLTFKTQQTKEADAIENQVIPIIYLFLSCLDFPSLAGFRCKLIYIQNR